MKRLFTILISFLISLSSFAGANFDIGTPFGSIVLNSMTGHHAGDTANIVSGAFTSFDFSHLDSIFIRNKYDTAHVVITGGGNIFDNVGVRFSSRFVHIRFVGIAGRIFNNNTPNPGSGLSGTEIDHLDFVDCIGALFDCGGNMPWTSGIQSTYHWYDMNIHDITTLRGKVFCSGAFGSFAQPGGHPPDVVDSIQLWNILDDQNVMTNFIDQCFFGNFLRFRLKDVYVVSKGIDSVGHGDVGWIHISGNGDFSNFYKWGRPGYNGRIFPISENSHPRTIRIYNTFKGFSKDYGLWNVQYDANTSVTPGISSCDAYIYNNTLIHTGSTINYWSSLAVIGEMGPSVAHIYNNVASDVVTNGKPKIAMNMGASILDTSNNYYLATTAAFKFDSSHVVLTTPSGNYYSYVPTAFSPYILHTGIPSSLSTVDFAGNPMRTPNPDMGAWQLPGAVPFCNCSYQFKTSKRQ